MHLFATDLNRTIAFYKQWFDAEVTWDGDHGGARNIFMKIGIGTIHLCQQPPREQGRNAVHHLGMQVVGLDELYQGMQAAGLSQRADRPGSAAGLTPLRAAATNPSVSQGLVAVRIEI